MALALVVVVACVLLLVGLCYAGRPYWAWVVALGFALAAWGVGGSFRSPVFVAAVALSALVALLFGVRALRRALVTSWLMPLVARALPRMSDTEREALEAGTVGWDAELFSGDPDWRAWFATPLQPTSAREQAFLDGPLEELCKRLDDFQVTKDGDLPPEVWEFVKSAGFMGMIIPREFGGLEFSAQTQSIVIAKLSARCVTAAVTVMVPNSLGPAELLLHYGTDEQKRHWLPRLARGEEVPCFALTEPSAGSDAASMKSQGVVCRGTWREREVLGIRLDWDKRYITLAPVATVLGLAFKLKDPERLLGGEVELGITCALIPCDTPGVEIGERHDPLGIPFMNGPTHGHGVFVPLDFVIGGRAQAGRGWRMLMQCLSAGRGISLPSLSIGACELATRVTGAYATVREQFGLPIGRFEGIEARLARIAGLTYLVDAARAQTLAAIDAGGKPAVLTAIMKAYSTESMRVVINDAMDLVGGAGICRGPRNALAHAYQSVPIGITVEGANILTRSMIIFGQGAIRCHPYVQDELAAAGARDVSRFDRAFFGHVGFVFVNAARAFVLGVTGARFVAVPAAPTGALGEPLASSVRQLTRFSASFAFLADLAMGTLGAALKRKENLSGRLADALAWMVFASGAVKKFADEGRPERDLPALRWALEHALHETQRAIVGLLENLPSRPVAALARIVVLPLGARLRPPSDRLGSQLAHGMLDDRPERLALTRHLFIPPADEPGLGMLEHALDLVVAAQEARGKVRDAQKQKKLERAPEAELLEAAVKAGIIDEDERRKIVAAERARAEAVAVDAFEPRVLAELTR